MSTPATVEDQRPAALIGEQEGATAPRVAVGLDRRTLLVGAGVAIAVLVVGLFLPLAIADDYYMGIAVDGVVLGIFAVGLGFLAHRCGLISLGHTAFYGSAAYCLAIATSNWGWGPTTAAAFGIVGGTLLAAGVGALVIRTTGFGFLMLTLAFGQALYQTSILTSMRDVTGAFDGLIVTLDGDASFLGLDAAALGDERLFWPLAWSCLVLVCFGLWLVGRSRLGVTLEAIRENEERARFSGYNTYLPRLAAFTISGACASLAGALFALRASFVSPDVLNFATAGDSLIATLVGGFTTLAGPVVGAVLYTFAQGEFSEGGNLQLYTGLALIIVVVFLPGGLAGSAVRAVKRIRARTGGSGR